MIPEICPICHQTVGCSCSQEFAPFQLYDHYGHGCGAFADVKLAVHCKALLDKSSCGPAKLFNRQGLPVPV